MLQSRHFAGKPLTGKGLKRFSTTLHCGGRTFSAHHLGVRQQNFKKESDGNRWRFDLVRQSRKQLYKTLEVLLEQGCKFLLG
jgi:hypothetical protein